MYGNNNPYFQPRYLNMNIGQQIGQQMPQFVPQQPQMQNIQSITPQPIVTGLQGKIVESADMVKTTEIPFDGSVSYFPLVNGSSIFTKQLQADGTIKNIEYRPFFEEENKQRDEESITYLTVEDLNEAISNIDLSGFEDLKNEMKELRKEINSIKESKKIEIERFSKDIKKKKSE